ncbi:MAG TPA: cytosine permease, partial [Paenisporosarcina sp.]|nr:cytosine permease [Paenisporosarcina sp.]
MPWLVSFSAVWIGAILAFLCVSALSIPGALYGLPGQYILRAFVGSWLAT